METLRPTVLLTSPPKAAADSKIILLNAASAILEVLQWLTDTHMVPTGITLVVVNFITILLRIYTNQPLRLLQMPKWLGGKS